MVLRNGGESRLWATRENEGIREPWHSNVQKASNVIHSALKLLTWYGT